MSAPDLLATYPRTLDAESRAWVERLRGDGPDRERALGELHALLVRAARFEVGRRIHSASRLHGEREDLAQQSADDALVALIAKLEDFRGASRFTTWAYKFALYEAAVKTRRRAWQGRELQLDSQAWPMVADPGQTPHEGLEKAEFLRTLQEAVRNDLSPRQREVLVAVTLNDVPIDVLAQRLQTSRGALYKTLHDARRKLRAALAERDADADASEVSRL